MKPRAVGTMSSARFVQMTRVYGVIGYPVAHSLSPAMHNAAIEARSLPGVYSAFEIPPRQLSRILSHLLAAGVQGLNVTVPHKEAVYRYLLRHGTIDPTARAIGAVNTLVRRGARFEGHNTDVIGFQQALARGLRCSARGKRVLVLGAGGAARAVIWALLRACPAYLGVANRTVAHANALVRWSCRAEHSAPLRGTGAGVQDMEALSWECRALRSAAADVDLVVNATSLGLNAGDPLPIDPQWLGRRTKLMDLVYHPSGTKLVQAARRRGVVAIDGLPMLLYQGVAAFELWWKRRAPVDVMRRALHNAVRTAR